MKENDSELKKPSVDLLKGVISEIEKSKNRKLEITTPKAPSPWIFRMMIISGTLFLVILSTRIVSISSSESAIIGTGTLLLAVAGFTFPLIINNFKKRKDL